MVIDINYFPGFEKLPNYENLMVRTAPDRLTNWAETICRIDISICLSVQGLSAALRGSSPPPDRVGFTAHAVALVR